MSPFVKLAFARIPQGDDEISTSEPKTVELQNQESM
jgi:hypothetical protein